MHHATEKVVQTALWSVGFYLPALITDFFIPLVSVSQKNKDCWEPSSKSLMFTTSWFRKEMICQGVTMGLHCTHGFEILFFHVL